MKKICITGLALLLSAHAIKAQYFDNVYPFSNDIVTNKLTNKTLIPLEKGALVINSLSNGNTLLTYIDLFGNRAWAKEYDFKEAVEFKSGVATDDGNFLIIGTNSSSINNRGYIVKVDAGTGNITWEKDYLLPQRFYTEFNTLTRTNEAAENYIIAATKRSLTQNVASRLHFMKISGVNGSSIWAKDYYDPLNFVADEINIPSFIGETPGASSTGEILVAGTHQYPGLVYNVFTIGINNSGTITKTYREYHFTQSIFKINTNMPWVAFSSAGGYLMTFNYEGNHGGINALRIDASDGIQWNYNYSFASFSENMAGAAFELEKNSFNLSGWGYDPIAAKKYPLMMNIDKDGVPQWGKRYIKANSYKHISMMPTKKTDFVMHTLGDNKTFSLMRVNEMGENSDCYDVELPVQRLSVTTPVKTDYVILDIVPEPATNNIEPKDRKSEDTDCRGNALKNQGNSKLVRNNELSLAQDPDDNTISLRSASAEEITASVEIRNILGQQISKKEMLLQPGRTFFSQDVFNGSKGVLLLIVTLPGEQPQSFKIISK